MSNLRELDDGTIQKQCSRCQTWRRIPEGFFLDKQSPDGFAGQCHKCRATAKAVWMNSGSPSAEKAREASRKRMYRLGKAFAQTE